MKILVLSNLYPPHFVGGYELYCRTVADALRSRGHTVEVLTSNHGVEGGGVAVEPHVTRSLRIHGMFGHPWHGISGLEKLERHNNQELARALDRVRPDIVYVWNCSGLSKSLLLTLQRRGVPTTISMCDHWIARCKNADVWLRWWNREDAPGLQSWVRKALEWVGQRRRLDATAPTNPVSDLRFPRIYFCSKALRQLTVDAGFSVEHGAVIHCAVNTERFCGTPKRGSEPVRKLLYVGRLTEDKGVMTALKAMALVRNKFAGSLSILGNGEADYEKRMKDFVMAEKLPVTFHAGASPEQMPAVYREHDALLFTSEWAEPFAITPLEAMASGLPVIATLTGGSAELFRHGENALTYTAGKEDELAQRILELDKNSALREKIAVTGYQEVRQRFSEPTIVDQAEAYLKESVATWRPAGLPRFDA